jgi:hypothetical protein
MNKRQIIASLNNIANELDNNGLYSEANNLTKIMSKIAMEQFDFPDEMPMFDENEHLVNPKSYSDESILNEKDYSGPTKCPECDSDNVMIDDEGNPVFCDDCGWDEMEESEDIEDGDFLNE